MKIVFFMFHAGFVRNYDPVLRALAERGHTIQLRHDILRKPWELIPANALAAAYPNITVGQSPARRVPATWTRLATVVRYAIDYLRYLHPDYAAATGLRARATERAPRGIVGAGQLLQRFGFAWVRAAMRLLRAVDRVIPTVPEIDRFLKKEAPDLVVVTPLVDFGSRQVDYIKSAQRLGIRTAAWVASWDNLTNKGLMRARPDRVFVWNHAQQREAVAYHDIPAERVVVTGAQIFDHWFGRTPRRSREEFCRHVGLDPATDFILYLGSSAQIAPDEVGFGASWVRLLRHSGVPELEQASILFRPHPARVPQWLALDSARLPGVVIWPREAATNAFDAGFNDDYFDSMWYARVIVGVNTSGMIESAILGKPVHTWRTPEFTAAQAGTLHFQHLLNDNGGLLHVATTAEDHVRMLAEALRAPAGADERSRRFVESFVRPYGLDQPATPRFVDAVEQLVAAPAPAPVAAGPGALAARPLLRLAAPVVVTAATDLPFWEILLRGVVAVAVRAVILSHQVSQLFTGAPGRQSSLQQAQRMLARVSRVSFKRAQRGARGVRAGGRAALRELGRGRRQWGRDAGRWQRRASHQVREAGKTAQKQARRLGKSTRKLARTVSRPLVLVAAGVARRLARLW